LETRRGARTLELADPLRHLISSVPIEEADRRAVRNRHESDLLLTGGALLSVYFRYRPVALREAVLVGALWTGFNLLFDYPMFAFGPMQMTVGAYYSEIGLSYLAFPALAYGAARLARR